MGYPAEKIAFPRQTVLYISPHTRLTMDYTQVLLVLGLLAINLVSAGKPMFRCDEEEVESSLHAKDFNFNCSVTSDPPVKGCQVYWYLFGHNDTEVDELTGPLNDGEEHGEISFTCDVDGKSAFLSLDIGRMSAQHFHTYVEDGASPLLLSPLSLLLTIASGLLLSKL